MGRLVRSLRDGDRFILTTPDGTKISLAYRQRGKCGYRVRELLFEAPASVNIAPFPAAKADTLQPTEKP